MIAKELKRQIVDEWSLTLPETLPSDGILVLDKPSGPTSHDLVYAVRRRYGNPKVGHTGTLDPLASGLMILLVDNATKRAKEFEGLDKTYEVECVLGIETDTFDSEGQVTTMASVPLLQAITQTQVEAAVITFVGTQQQQVPAFSAVKVGGKALYKMARQGTVDQVALPVKTITIYELDLLHFQPYDAAQTDSNNRLPHLKLRVSCSKGTYVRSLISDFGKKIGAGACVTMLRRTHIGLYSL